MKHVRRFKTRVLGRSASPAGPVLENPSLSVNTPEPESQSSSVGPTEPTEPPKEKRGLFKLADSKPDPSGPRNYPVDIIAVHGLNGDAFSTWRHQPDGTMWLRDLLPESLPGCRVYTYGYPSKIFSQSSARVQEYARNLLISLRDIREVSDTVLPPASPILVMSDSWARANVPSSLYAIALALVIAHEDDNLYGEVLKSVIGVAFLATPHRGSTAANLASVFGTIVSTFRATRTDLLNHLIYDSDALQDLNTSARNRLGNISVVSCYEDKPTPPLSSLIVSRASATLDIPNEEPIRMFGLNHKSICRFSGETESYMRLAGALRRIASRSSDASPTLERASTHSSNISHPGSGKTTLSYSLAQYFNDARARSRNVLIYLCQNKNKQTDGRAVLIGLILQIIDRHRSMIRHVRSVFERQGSSMIRSFALLWRIFLRIVTDPKVGPLYVILDALDECEEASRQKLLESIYDILADSSQPMQSGSRVKFLITSRPFLHQSYANTKKALQCQISIDDDQTGYTDDLRVFIQERVHEISLNRQFSSDIREFLYQTITSKADRTFLWIHMVLASIEKSLLTSKKDFQKIMASIPEGLAEIYQQYLSAIPVDHQDDASNLLKLVLACSRPLHLDELNIAFTIDASHMTADDVMRDTQNSITHTVQGILGSLVRVTGRHVSLVHQSVKDFLLEQVAAKYDSFPAMRTVNAQSSALQLATVCIQYLLLDDFTVDFFPTKDSPTGPVLDLLDELPLGDYGGNFWDDEDDNLTCDVLFREPDALHPNVCDSLISNYAFYSYASLHWAEHFAICEEAASDHLRDAARSLLDVNAASCRNWLHFYRTRADASTDDNLLDQDPILLASQFNLHTILNEMLGSCEPSQAIKNQSLYWASRFGHDRIVASLLRADAEPNSRHLEGRTALTTASEHGNSTCVVKLLADKRTDVNMPGRSGRNALSFACGGGHDNIVNELLSRSACNADDPDNSGTTPLLWAVGGGHHSIISTLARLRSVNINHRDKTGRTAISWASGDGMADTLVRLLKVPGIDVNIKDNKGKSPLSWAAGNGHADAIEVLLTRKTVDKASIDNDKRNAISWACAGGHHDVLIKLLDGGCPGVDTEDIDGWTPLAWAIQTDAPDTVQVLVNNKQVQIERRDPGGRTALYWAVEYGHARVVKVLLEAGADPEAKDNRGNTPISAAKQYGRDDVLSELMVYRV
ncbi:ankyrin repeat-containing [Fusarium albosuccineum]|uniref:Ankyrin repeat-containing n=1 Tax=Fusarium albosuccineum TaxID=1237068 RepID=A0A8H4P854_9HYPO|nr:ankyrin repeat-containing [Fusarium albosuccineum]